MAKKVVFRDARVQFLKKLLAAHEVPLPEQPTIRVLRLL
jgi:hypothetical protein